MLIAVSWVWLAALFLSGVLSGCSGVPQDDDDDLPPADIELVCDRDYYPLLREMVESADGLAIGASIDEAEGALPPPGVVPHLL